MTSSFLSFPSFSTFPDVDHGTSSRNSDSEPSQKRRKSDQVSRAGRKERSESQEVDKERQKKRKPLTEKGRKRDGNRDRHKHKDKERVKEKEKDSERNDGRKSKYNRDNDEYKHLSIDNLTSDQQKADVDLKNHDESYKIFFTDTKGDNLYLQYGSLYARDVPKYRLYHGVLHFSDFRNV